MKTKVAHIITLLELGGAQGNTLFTVITLDRNKYDVMLICGRGGIQDPVAEKIQNLKCIFLDTMIRSIHPIKDLLCLYQLTKILKKEKLDIVHTHSSKAGILGRIAARLAGVPIIIHSIHGFGFNPYQNFLVRRLFIILEKWCAGFTTTLIAVSQRNIDLGLKHGIGTQNQYQLIRSGVDIQNIKNRVQNSQPNTILKDLNLNPAHQIILTIGPFKVQKDPVAFVTIAQKILNVKPETQFLMVGDGELKEQVQQKIKMYGIEKSIHLLGWRKDIPEILNLCTVFVLTSRWEGLPRSAVEALIVGKPVIAFDVDGVSEVVKNGENGYTVKANLIDDFADKLNKVLSDLSHYKYLSENTIKTIDQSFDIHFMVSAQEKLYDQLIQSISQPERP